MDTLASFWRYARDNDKPLQSVWAVIDLDTGTMITWNLSKRAAQKNADRRDNVHLVRMVPAQG